MNEIITVRPKDKKLKAKLKAKSKKAKAKSFNSFVESILNKAV